MTKHLHINNEIYRSTMISGWKFTSFLTIVFKSLHCSKPILENEKSNKTITKLGMLRNRDCIQWFNHLYLIE